MNQKTKTALYSLATCACIISAATAVILTINAKNREPEQQVTAVEEPAEEEQPRAERPRRRGGRNRGGGGGGGFRDDRRRGDMVHLLPDEDALANMPTPEEFEEEVIKGLEEYRALTPEQKFEQVRQMHQVTQFVNSAIEMFRENIAEIPTDELIRIQNDFDRFADAMSQTVFSGIVEQHLTAEEDATIGEFMRSMHDAQDEFQMILHGG
jgi:hypothetical protein